MKEYLGWFYNLTEREQKLVSAGAISFVVALLYFLVWSPIQQDYERQKIALAADENLLNWVNEQADKALLLRGASQGKSFRGSLTQVVNSTARASNISIARIQPQGDNLQISIDSAQFDQYLRWINTLEQRGIRILYADVTETEQTGFVQVRRLQIGANE